MILFADRLTTGMVIQRLITVLKTSIWIKNGAQLNMESGEKFVSRAEINVDTWFTDELIKELVFFWTRGITIGSSFWINRQM